ncbi:hypothetical protein [Bernardetia sp.]|uniref:hypothetical protein n=1 Tax=Bernardetia sp. TaxID=1937974 RepID=UPI0025BF462D|nr:hypothetical protein [Bernardetia sp.]
MKNKYLKFSFFLFLAIITNPFFTKEVLELSFVVHSYVYQLLTGILSLTFLSISIVVILSKEENLIRFLKPKINRYEDYLNRHYIDEKLNPNILAIYRISFSIVNFILIYNYFLFFDVIWFHIEYESNILLLKSALWVWLLASLLLLFGIGGRLVGVVQLIVAVFITRNVYTFGIFEFTILCNIWAFVLLRTDYKFSLNNFLYKQKNVLRFIALTPKQTPVIFLYVLGIYFGFIFLLAGVDKLIDPLWFEGNGFYAFCTMPWTLPKYLEFITRSRIITYIANYSSVFIEIIFLPLFLFRKTRTLSICLATTLFLGLIYPFNIFFIGIYAVLFGFLLSSSFPIFTSLIDNEEKKLQILLPFLTKKRLILGSAFIAIYFISYNFSKILLNSTINSINAMQEVTETIPSSDSYDLNSLVVKHQSEQEEYLNDLHLEELYSFSKILKTWFIRFSEVKLFSSRHLIGQYAYRVIITKKDGTKVEPIKYFMKDKSRGEFDRNYFMLNIFQGAMYMHGDMANRLAYRIKLEPRYVLIYRFLHYSAQKSNLDMNEIAYISTFVAPIKVPIEYKGTVKQNEKEWKEMIRFSEGKGYEMIEKPIIQPYQARNINQSNYLPRVLYKSLQKK